MDSAANDDSRTSGGQVRAESVDNERASERLRQPGSRSMVAVPACARQMVHSRAIVVSAERCLCLHAWLRCSEPRDRLLLCPLHRVVAIRGGGQRSSARQEQSRNDGTLA